MTLPKVTHKLKLNSLISRSFFLKVNITKSTTDILIILTQISNSLQNSYFLCGIIMDFTHIKQSSNCL